MWPVFIDTDIGDDIDDALALALATRLPEIELLGVSTVFGETRQRARLAAHLLHVFGQPGVPVAAGCGEPLLRRHRPSGVPQAAILDRQADLTLSELDGPNLLIQMARAHASQLILLCLGPLTNIATALRREPGLVHLISRIIMMGGTSGLPWPEWNVRSDALAARIVLAAGIPLTLIGWNVTRQCQLRRQDLEQLRAGKSAQSHLLWHLIQVWQRHRPRWHSDLPYLHDPLTVVALCAPNLLKFAQIPVHVVTSGPLQGLMTPRLPYNPHIHAAIDLQPSAARAWITQRLDG